MFELSKRYQVGEKSSEVSISSITKSSKRKKLQQHTYLQSQAMSSSLANIVLVPFTFASIFSLLQVSWSYLHNKQEMATENESETIV